MSLPVDEMEDNSSKTKPRSRTRSSSNVGDSKNSISESSSIDLSNISFSESFDEDPSQKPGGGDEAHKWRLYSYYGISVTPPASDDEHDEDDKASGGIEPSQVAGVNHTVKVHVDMDAVSLREVDFHGTSSSSHVPSSSPRSEPGRAPVDNTPPISPGAALLHPLSVPRVPGRKMYKPKAPPRGPSLDEILKDANEFPEFIKFVGEDRHQDVLFICEVDQFLERSVSMKEGDILQQMQKIVHIYLSDDAPACVMCLSKKTSALIKECVRREEFHANAFRKAKQEVEATLKGDVLRRYWDLKNKQKASSGDAIVDPEEDLQLRQTLDEFDIERTFMLYLMRDRRHRLLLFWLHMVHSGVPDLESNKFSSSHGLGDIVKRAERGIGDNAATGNSEVALPFSDTTSSTAAAVAEADVDKETNEQMRLNEEDIDDKLLRKVLRGCSNRMHLLHTLQDIYHKFVSFGVNSASEDTDLDSGLLQGKRSQVSRVKAVQLSNQLNIEITNLLNKLKPMYTKVDKILRLQCWPQFCKSDEYAALLNRRRELKKYQELASTFSRPTSIAGGTVAASSVRSGASLPVSATTSPVGTPRSLAPSEVSDSPRSQNGDAIVSEDAARNVSNIIAGPQNATRQQFLNTTQSALEASMGGRSPRSQPSLRDLNVQGSKTRIRNFVSYIKNHPGTKEMIIANCAPEQHRNGVCRIHTGSRRLVEGVVFLQCSHGREADDHAVVDCFPKDPSSTTAEPSFFSLSDDIDTDPNTAQTNQCPSASGVGEVHFDSVYQSDLFQHVVPHLSSFCFPMRENRRLSVTVDYSRSATSSPAAWSAKLVALMDDSELRASSPNTSSSRAPSEEASKSAQYHSRSRGFTPSTFNRGGSGIGGIVGDASSQDKIFPLVLNAKDGRSMHLACLLLSDRPYSLSYSADDDEKDVSHQNNKEKSAPSDNNGDDVEKKQVDVEEGREKGRSPSATENALSQSFAVCLVSSRPISSFLQRCLGYLYDVLLQIEDAGTTKNPIQEWKKTDEFRFILRLTQCLSTEDEQRVASLFFSASPVELDALHDLRSLHPLTSGHHMNTPTSSINIDVSRVGTESVKSTPRRRAGSSVFKVEHGPRSFAVPVDGWSNECQFNARNPAIGTEVDAFNKLFQCLHPSRVLTVLQCLLLERKVLLVSSQITVRILSFWLSRFFMCECLVLSLATPTRG